jgi:hypothetical protein
MEPEFRSVMRLRTASEESCEPGKSILSHDVPFAVPGYLMSAPELAQPRYFYGRRN